MGGFLTTLIGKAAGEGIASPIQAVGNVIDALFTSDEEKLDKQALLKRIAQEPAMVQAEINRVEAVHRTVFVAGWRPFIGWVCGMALAYNFICRDIIVWAATVLDTTVPIPPALQMDELMTVLLGLLGLGTLRTIEKIGAVSR
jgi:hypothetical protein